MAFRNELVKIDANVPELPGKRLVSGDKLNKERQAAFSALLEYCVQSEKLQLCTRMHKFLNIMELFPETN